MLFQMRSGENDGCAPPLFIDGFYDNCWWVALRCTHPTGAGKSCPKETALEIYNSIRGYPYYVQKLASIAWDLTARQCTTDTVRAAFRILLPMEAQDFEGIWSGLTLIQRGLLKALAQEPTISPYAREFLERHRLSVGGTQRAMNGLLSRDLIERDDKNIYRLTDPVMGVWLKEN
ncbi:MAG: MarR family transcriptional regulator [Deltaproteobacteria bacterium]|nr:MarR family transcriptional regulator [Deltaproteobacteria bacterium]